MNLPSQFEAYLDQYRANVEDANSEGTLVYLFLEFVRSAFGTIDADYANRCLPQLERSIQLKEATLFIRGRIDVLLNNLIIEFKRHLDQVGLEETQEKLRRYAAALYAEQCEDYLTLASDGKRFIVYLPKVSNAYPESVQLQEVDRLDISKSSARDIYLWLDRYLLQEGLRSPTTESFINEFGAVFFHVFVLPHLRNLWDCHKGNYQGLYQEWANYLSIAYGTRVESEKLFLRHTYLATLAKLMVYQLFSPGGSPSNAFLQNLLNGAPFIEWGITNFIEEDFFSWIGRHPEGLDIVRSLSKRLSQFNMTHMNEDILKGIYQNLVDPEERHDLGEYYTPEWIAQYIIYRVLQDDPQKSILDPACGSGTFLSIAIRCKLERIILEDNQLLRHILNSVMGVDIHPLAVIIAKANYLIALRPLLKIKDRQLSLPVYLADSLQPQVQETELDGVRSYQKVVDADTSLYLPALDDHTTIDNVVDVIKQYALQLAQDPNRESNIRFPLPEGKQLSPSVISVLQRTSRTLAKLINDPKLGDTIWAFVLKNFYKPAFLLHRFDVIVGNPPWLSYRYVDNPDYQQVLKKLITEHYGLTTRAELITHMELATLFFLASAENYLARGGEIAFVMPRAVFTADQHAIFREGTYRHLRLDLTHIDDLDQVRPIFGESSGTVPACLLFAKKDIELTYPVSGHVQMGRLPTRNASLELIESNLTLTEAQFSLIRRGHRSFLSADTPSISPQEERSFYYSKFHQGATITPRQFWFVDIPVHQDFGFNPEKPFLRSSTRAIRKAKKEYQEAKIEGNVERQFLYATLTSSELLPFAYLPMPLLVLPLRVEAEAYILCDQEWALCHGFTGLALWLEKGENLWKERRGVKAGQINLYERLNYHHELTRQKPITPFRVLYTTSGTHLVACTINLTNVIKIKVNGTYLPLSGFIADAKTYWYGTNDNSEALYLSAVLNSETLDRIVKPMQSRGLWGPRDFHKKPLEFPIPRYNAEDLRHQQLAKLGALCTQKTHDRVRSAPFPKGLSQARQQTRSVLQVELQEIDRLVTEILLTR